LATKRNFRESKFCDLDWILLSKSEGLFLHLHPNSRKQGAIHALKKINLIGQINKYKS
jgi:hypothetical protein